MTTDKNINILRRWIYRLNEVLPIEHVDTCKIVFFSITCVEESVLFAMKEAQRKLSLTEEVYYNHWVGLGVRVLNSPVTVTLWPAKPSNKETIHSFNGVEASLSTRPWPSFSVVGVPIVASLFPPRFDRRRLSKRSSHWKLQNLS